MILTIKRLSRDDDSTIGAIAINGVYSGFTLEDEMRFDKVAGETRIPSGSFDLVFQDNITPMTEKYRKKYAWFDKHLMIKDVPNFSTVYIHIGNTDDDTEGCILLGDTCNSNLAGDGFVGSSKACFKRFYEIISNTLLSNESVRIEILDENQSWRVYNG